MTSSSKLSVNYIEVSALNKYKSNPRTHSPKQIKQIAKSIREFGFTNPILIDSQKNILAGHGRVMAAAEIGLQTVPTIELAKMTEAQKKAYIIADNKLAENAGWDLELLKLEFGALSELDASFDLTLTGFEMGEIDFSLSDSSEDAEEPIPLPPVTPISKPGDVWILGKHKLICGDALDPSSFEAVLGNQKASIVFTDPPYNVPVDGHVCGNGKIKHEDFAMASGEMSEEQFIAFLKGFITNLINFTKNGSLHYICMDWRHISELLSAGKGYSEFKNLCVWNKTTGGMGSLYRSQHELVFLFKNGSLPHINNVQLGKHGRNRTNVWDYVGVNSFKNKEKQNELAMHPTVKPVKMIADAILDCSNRNDIILDCFGGSGSALIAAEQTGRRAALIEFDPKYVDVTIERFEKKTGLKAVHQESRQSFSDLKASLI